MAVDRLRKRFISFICDKRDTKTFLKLWEQLKNRNINVFCSDYWKSYSELIPSERHVTSKALIQIKESTSIIYLKKNNSNQQ
ncbi:IS1 family transposase [Riemerella anatipestifer]|uniref:IS1 family transposase n=1 Tax=Riemerella anatipestifer TaxID=34085 RepID=UPI0035B69AE5